MFRFHNLFKQFVGDEQGLTTVEYALAGALTSLALLASFTNLGGAVADRINAMTAFIS